MDIYCRRSGLDEDATTVCLRMWTFVHGTASLLIDEDYDSVVPGFDYKSLLITTTPMLLGATP